MSPERAAIAERFRQAAQAGMSPGKVADHVFHAIRTEQLYILTHPELSFEIRKRMDHILQQRNPDLGSDSYRKIRHMADVPARLLVYNGEATRDS